MNPEKQNDGAFAAPWLEKREKSGSSLIDDTDYLAMLEEMRLSSGLTA